MLKVIKLLAALKVMHSSVVHLYAESGFGAFNSPGLLDKAVLNAYAVQILSLLSGYKMIHEEFVLSEQPVSAASVYNFSPPEGY